MRCGFELKMSTPFPTQKKCSNFLFNEGHLFMGVEPDKLKNNSVHLCGANIMPRAVYAND